MTEYKRENGKDFHTKGWENSDVIPYYSYYSLHSSVCSAVGVGVSILYQSHTMSCRVSCFGLLCELWFSDCLEVTLLEYTRETKPALCAASRYLFFTKHDTCPSVCSVKQITGARLSICVTNWLKSDVRPITLSWSCVWFHYHNVLCCCQLNLWGSVTLWWWYMDMNREPPCLLLQ